MRRAERRRTDRRTERSSPSRSRRATTAGAPRRGRRPMLVRRHRASLASRRRSPLPRKAGRRSRLRKYAPDRRRRHRDHESAGPACDARSPSRAARDRWRQPEDRSGTPPARPTAHPCELSSRLRRRTQHRALHRLPVPVRFDRLDSARRGDHSPEQLVGGLVGGPSRVAARGQPIANCRSTSINCFIVRTKSPPDSSSASTTSAKPSPAAHANATATKVGSGGRCTDRPASSSISSSS